MARTKGKARRQAARQRALDSKKKPQPPKLIEPGNPHPVLEPYTLPYRGKLSTPSPDLVAIRMTEAESRMAEAAARRAARRATREKARVARIAADPDSYHTRILREEQQRQEAELRRRQPPQRVFYQHYHGPNVPIGQIVHFNSIEDFDSSRLVRNIRSVRFGGKFRIQDSHIEALIAAGPEFCQQLTEFQSKSPDNGYGSTLTDNALCKLAEACPRLARVEFKPSVSLSDVALLAFLNHCPNIYLGHNWERLGNWAGHMESIEGPVQEPVNGE
ncbi:hypothetical protein BU16DRAFT_394197 [Lophium mytilinum]|uniref:Uncharacterized protein n=1 Tax=Lophium mytilinum TaxID=390894 RepID=A0A6A6QU13_9PEZI|nr:hypothetical protein BU16DRAFT_394197 [Lophium mytilinum]